MEELGFVRNENEKERLLGWSVPEVMENFVFPRCLCLPRSGRRYPRIDGSFMELMARHGKDFLTADYELGSVLLELAMQRITKHPDLPAIEYYKILPEKWRAYSAASSNPEGMNGCPDEPGLWGSEEVHFLQQMLPVCLKLKERKYADHAKLILFQEASLLCNGRFLWLSDEHYCDVKEVTAWKTAVSLLFEENLVQEFVDYCVGKGWRVGKKLFQSPRFYGQDEEYLLSRIDLSKETYYKGFKRKALGWLGLYNSKTRKRILAELRSA
ncbi:MAG: hypothetical protein J6J35_02475 [Alphaproteobacteria bacterium]|nr:hypothetical protein [Alphaproteobacteria bacterium]